MFMRCAHNNKKYFAAGIVYELKKSKLLTLTVESGRFIMGVRGGKGLLLALCLSLVGVEARAYDYGYVNGEVIVKYKDNVRRDKGLMDELYRLASVERVSRFRGVMRGIEHLFISQSADMDQVIEQLRTNPAVEYAHPNYILRAMPVAEHYAGEPLNAPFRFPCILPGVQFPPNCVAWQWPDFGRRPNNKPAVAQRPADTIPPVADPDLAEAYGIAKIGADRAWSLHRGTENFVVAVIDTGIDYNHEDLAYNVWRNPNPGRQNDVTGFDFVHNDGFPFDDNRHGTHCAGTIGATGGNGKGVSGVAQRVSIMSLKFLDARGSGSTANAIKAIDYAVTNGAKVLSNSWGGGSGVNNRGLEDAINRASSAGVLFVAAAGNDGKDNDSSPTYPAGYRTPNMIAVAATDENDQLASFSNTGAESVHIAAPGVRVYSTVPGGKYAKLSGTSMATPHVAGAAALLWSASPGLTMAEVKDRLLRSADRVDALRGKTITGGRLNIVSALAAESL